MPGKVHGDSVRARARAIRDIGSDLAARFRQSQLDTVRPALLIDGGRVAVTDNYLKVQVPQSHPDNTRVRVRITSVDPLGGEVTDA
jgi:hypothetical protein